MMFNPNANQLRVLQNLEGAIRQGRSWRSAIHKTDITTESGARGLLKRLVEVGLASGGPDRFHITPSGRKLLTQLKAKRKEKREAPKPIKLF